MHEYSLTKALIEQVRLVAHQNDAERVIEVVVEAGPLSNVEPLLMLTAFEQLTLDNELSGVRLTIREVPLMIRCHACGQDSALEQFIFTCPNCASESVGVISGDELILKHVELYTHEMEESA